MSDVLRTGDKGSDVARLQGLLNRYLRPSPGLEVDGAFGPLTDRAVRTYQAQVGLGIDGVVGKLTWAALEKGQTREHATIPVSVGNASWMAVAMREMGQREIAGPEHNPRILEYHATTTLRATSDETAWCSSFVNWCLKRVRLLGTDSAAAASWLKWGTSGRGTGGAITVIFNVSAAASLSVSGNHVGFLVEETGSHYKLLGGNQSNRVKVSSFPKSSWTLKGYRWPARSGGEGKS